MRAAGRFVGAAPDVCGPRQAAGLRRLAPCCTASRHYSRQLPGGPRTTSLTTGRLRTALGGRPALLRHHARLAETMAATAGAARGLTKTPAALAGTASATFVGGSWVPTLSGCACWPCLWQAARAAPAAPAGPAEPRQRADPENRAARNPVIAGLAPRLLVARQLTVVVWLETGSR